MKLIMFLLASAALPQQGSERYLDCVSLVEADLEVGRLAAQQWAGEGGGPEAHHCLALADIAAGYPKLAAIRLEELGERKNAGNEKVRARLFDQAAQAWLEAGELDEAQRVIGKALTMSPGESAILLTAARIHAAREEWTMALGYAETARKAGSPSAEASIISAKANIALGDYETAANDVVAALTVDPTNIDALTLRGEIQQTGITIEVFYGDEPEDK